MSSQKKNMGLKVLHDPKNSIADLVLVHGLNGHPIDTWTYIETLEDGSKLSVCWPKDLLPRVQPRIRVLSFGYSGDIYENNSVAGIRGNATSLLVHLKLRREDLDEKRPIIFLAHCLGGLIVKQAMCYADNKSQYSMIASATRGILFFGTPHFGADKNQWLAIVEALGKASAKTKGKPSTLVADMTSNSRALTAISEDFVHIAPKYAIKSAYETRELATIKMLVVPKMSTQMFGGAGEDAVAVDADHISMCQFSGEDDVDFEMTWRFIREAAESGVNQTSSSSISASRQSPEAEFLGTQAQAGHTQINNFIYIDASNMVQRSANPAFATRNDTTMLPSIMASGERFLPLAPSSREMPAPLALPAPAPAPPTGSSESRDASPFGSTCPCPGP
ncbi:hypothetical protein B0T16DRAFT_391337 [Cercophora newfieldiana]|uniref:DUF676 domain-containing protein n=1 Tax=Cercophora newfieldiana TaxID=92897 RepID=A0AA40CS05_9PEZI|nr:hypothetical protein B0T16DRAFT_391337 [Cercophora newfieldiana]